jgi:hypothetical protein
MLTFALLVIAVGVVAHAYYSLRSARALIEQAHALRVGVEQAVQAMKANAPATREQIIAAAKSGDDALLAQLTARLPQRRIIAINRYKVNDNDWAIMADADDGTVWSYDDDHGWLLSRCKRAIPQLPVEPTLKVKA